MPSALGVFLDGWNQPIKEALRSASRLSFREIEVPAVAGDIDPAQLSRSGRRDFLHYLSGLGLKLSALAADSGGARFNDSTALEQKLDKTRQIIEMAAELKVPVVTTHLGLVDDESLGRGFILEAVRALAEYSDRTGTFIAVESGGGEPQRLSELIRKTNCPTIAACYDPATMLIDGFDPLAGIEPLADRIVLARVRDAVAGSPRRPGHESQIGQGQIDMTEYFAALEAAGYRGTAFIRRAQSERPLQDIADAKKHVESLLSRR